MRNFFPIPGLLPTGPVTDGVVALRMGLANGYLVKAPRGWIGVDAGWSVAGARKALRAVGALPEEVDALLLTHLHWDHARAHRLYLAARVYVGAAEPRGPLVPPEDPRRPWTRLEDGQELEVAGLRMRAISIPGHTPGGMAFLIGDRLLFTGDALQLREGRAVPFPAWFGGDRAAMTESIRKLSAVGGVDAIYTAHSGWTRNARMAFEAWRADGAGKGVIA